MGEHPINGLMDSSLQNLRKLVDANTVVGEAITAPDGTVIIPVSKVAFGYGAGGADLPGQEPSNSFGGGSGGGVSVQPLAFLVISQGKVELLQLSDNKNTADRVVGMIPDLFDRINSMVSKGKENKEEKEKEKQEPHTS